VSKESLVRPVALRVLVVLVGLLAACGGDDGGPSAENCMAVGDEDGNGKADCDDPVCAGVGTCPAVCGNGKAEFSEGYDDGNRRNGDGDDANCNPTACGNGIKTMNEGCDDGNTTSGDGCDNNCMMTGCGNGAISPGETCDDGNTT